MGMSRGWNGSHLVVATILLSAATTAAHADPITSDGYTITDLGPGTPTFSTDANGNGIVIAPNGSVSYSFPQTPNTVLTPGQGIMANFPQFPSGPDYAHPGNQIYNELLGPIMNSSGLVAVMQLAGTRGYQYEFTEYAVQRNADGSWGQPISVYSGGYGYDVGAGLNSFSVVGLSKSNEILIYDSRPNNGGPSQAILYNVNTQTTTDLATVLGAAGIAAGTITPLAIDDQGRILVSGLYPYSGPPINFLLTPDGVSSDPIEQTVPEPSTLALLLLAITSYAIHHARRRHLVV